jgi:cholesterol transport system auxiliary component
MISESETRWSFRAKRRGLISRPGCGRRVAPREISLVGIFLLFSIIVAGCAAARPSKYYELTVPGDPAGDPPATSYPFVLLFGSLQTSHLYREDRIVYSSTGENMGTYEYQRWAEPPTEMIQELLFRQLRASGHYRSVYSERSNVRGDYVLRGHLYDFKEISGSKVLARVTLELEMREVKTGDTVWTHFYSHDEPVGGKDVSAVVSALNRNAQRAVAEFQSSLDQYFSSHPPGGSTQ